MISFCLHTNGMRDDDSAQPFFFIFVSTTSFNIWHCYTARPHLTFLYIFLQGIVVIYDFCCSCYCLPKAVFVLDYKANWSVKLRWEKYYTIKWWDEERSSGGVRWRRSGSPLLALSSFSIAIIYCLMALNSYDPVIEKLFLTKVLSCSAYQWTSG